MSRLPGIVAGVAALAVLPAPARAWSPGPYGFDRCVAEFDTALRGVVARVERAGGKPGGWVLSRAHVDVEVAYRGVERGDKRVSFYYWSATDGALTVPHSLAPGDRIVVFLSADLSPIGDITLNGKTGHFLQFAKANHRGYLYRVESADGRDVLRDAIAGGDGGGERVTLADAERALIPRKAEEERAPGREGEAGVAGGVIGGVLGGPPGGVPGGVLGGLGVRPGSGGRHPAIGGIGLGSPGSGSRTRDQIKAVIRAGYPRLRACYEAALRRAPGLAGRLTLAIHISTRGAVTAATVRASTLGDRGVEACVVRRVRALRFPAASAPSIVTYPFVFTAGAAPSAAGGSGAASGSGGSGAPGASGAASTPAIRVAPRVQVTAGAPSGNLGALDRRAIDRAMRAPLRGLRACYGRALRRDPALAGALVLALDIAADGRVARATVDAQASTLRSGRVRGCALRELRGVRVRGDGPASIRYPIDFRLSTSP